ncbi:MAG: hypothetical protein EZS28_044062, partial [Streblomastix strix]
IIDEIAANNFIEKIAFISKAPDETAQRALELLILMAQVGKPQIQHQIEQQVNSLKFLSLIGNSDLKFDERVVNYALKAGDNTDLRNSVKLLQKARELDTVATYKQNKIFHEDIFPSIVALLNSADQIITEQQKKNKPISDIPIGLLNVCSSVINNIIEDNQTVFQIIQTTIPDLVIKILRVLPLVYVKAHHLGFLFSISANAGMQYCQYMYRLGAVQALSRFYVLPGSDVAILTFSTLQNVIDSGLYLISSRSQCQLKLPHNFINPNTAETKRESIYKMIDENESLKLENEDTWHLLFSTQIKVFGGYTYNSKHSEMCLEEAKQEIIKMVPKGESISRQLDLLHQVSLRHENCKSVLKSGIIPLFEKYLPFLEEEMQKLLLDIFSTLFNIKPDHEIKPIKLILCLHTDLSVIDSEQDKYELLIQQRQKYHHCVGQ